MQKIWSHDASQIHPRDCQNTGFFCTVQGSYVSNMVKTGSWMTSQSCAQMQNALKVVFLDFRTPGNDFVTFQQRCTDNALADDRRPIIGWLPIVYFRTHLRSIKVIFIATKYLMINVMISNDIYCDYSFVFTLFYRMLKMIRDWLLSH